MSSNPVSEQDQDNVECLGEISSNMSDFRPNPRYRKPKNQQSRAMKILTVDLGETESEMPLNPVAEPNPNLVESRAGISSHMNEIRPSPKNVIETIDLREKISKPNDIIETIDLGEENSVRKNRPNPAAIIEIIDLDDDKPDPKNRLKNTGVIEIVDLDDDNPDPNILDNFVKTVGRKAQGTSGSSDKTVDISEVIFCYDTKTKAQTTSDDPIICYESPVIASRMEGALARMGRNLRERPDEKVYEIIYCHKKHGYYKKKRPVGPTDKPEDEEEDNPIPQSPEMASGENGTMEEHMAGSFPETEDEDENKAKNEKEILDVGLEKEGHAEEIINPKNHNEYEDSKVNPKGSTDQRKIGEEAISIPQSPEMASGENGTMEEHMAGSFPETEDEDENKAKNEKEILDVGLEKEGHAEEIINPKNHNEYEDSKVNPKGSTDQRKIGEEAISIPQSPEMASGETGTMEEHMAGSFPETEDEDENKAKNEKEILDVGLEKEGHAEEIINPKNHNEYEDSKVNPKGSTDQRKIGEEAISIPPSPEMESGEKGAMEEHIAESLPETEEEKKATNENEILDVGLENKRNVEEIIHNEYEYSKMNPKGSTNKRKIGEETISIPEDEPPRSKLAKLDYEHYLIKFQMSNLISCKLKFKVQAKCGSSKLALVKIMTTHLCSLEGQEEVMEILNFLERRHKL